MAGHNYIAGLIKYNKAFTFKINNFFTGELVAFVVVLQLGFKINWKIPYARIDSFLLVDYLAPR